MQVEIAMGLIGAGGAQSGTALRLPGIQCAVPRELPKDVRKRELRNSESTS